MTHIVDPEHVRYDLQAVVLVDPDGNYVPPATIVGDVTASTEYGGGDSIANPNAAEAGQAGSLRWRRESDGAMILVGNDPGQELPTFDKVVAGLLGSTTATTPITNPTEGVATGLGLLRGLVELLQLGQSAMSESVPVAIASDQGNLGVQVVGEVDMSNDPARAVGVVTLGAAVAVTGIANPINVAEMPDSNFATGSIVVGDYHGGMFVYDAAANSGDGGYDEITVERFYADISGAATATLASPASGKKVATVDLSWMCGATAGTLLFKSDTSAISPTWPDGANGGMHKAYNPHGHYKTATDKALKATTTQSHGVDGLYIEVVV